jgi:hypothetical protein
MKNHQKTQKYQPKYQHVGYGYQFDSGSMRSFNGRGLSWFGSYALSLVLLVCRPPRKDELFGFFGHRGNQVERDAAWDEIELRHLLDRGMLA